MLRRLGREGRLAAYHRGELDFGSCHLWAARWPHEVPLLNGEFEFIAITTPRGVRMNAGAPYPCGIPVHHDLEAGYCVFLCKRCGQPLTGPRDLSQSALHVGNDG
jgi:hypothetical protein